MGNRDKRGKWWDVRGLISSSTKASIVGLPAAVARMGGYDSLSKKNE